MQFHVARSVVGCSQDVVLYVYVDRTFTQVVIQIDRSLYIAHGFIHDDEVRLVYKEDCAAVFQPVVVGILSDQHLLVAFGLPEFRYGFRGLQVLLVQCQRVVGTGTTEPVTQFHHFFVACINVRSAVREEVFAIEPKFESAVVRLAVPFSFRTGFHHHYRSILLPSVSEGEESGSQCAMREVGQGSAFASFGGIIADPCTVGE